MKNTWHQSGNIFSLREVSNQVPTLPVGVYVLRFSMNVGFYLEHLEDNFEMPKKMYGLTEKFVDRVIKSFHTNGENLGVLLNGIRGTGKTVTCKKICNDIKLPVIIIDTNYDGVTGFLAEIQQEVVIFFDEFEKVFPRDYSSNPSKLLTIMDGVMKTRYKKLFLLTTNELTVEQNMIQRPGRIRYIKTFSNLTPEVIAEIVKDRLDDKSLAKQVVEFIAELELITVDIVTAICEEVNLFMELPEDFKDIFNIKKISELYAVFEIEKDETGKVIDERLVADNARVYPPKIEKNYEGYNFMVNRKNLGDIEEVIDSECVIVQPDTIYDEEGNEKEKPAKVMYRLQPRNSLNRVFSGKKMVDMIW